MRQGMLNMWANPGTGIQAQKPVLPPAKKMIHLWAGMQGLQTGFPLKKGDKKWQVLALQKGLNFLGSSIVEDGVMGSGTATAFNKVFGTAHKLEQFSITETNYRLLLWSIIEKAKVVERTPSTPAARMAALRTMIENSDATWRELVQAYSAIHTSESSLGAEATALRGQVSIISKKVDALQRNLIKVVLVDNGSKAAMSVLSNDGKFKYYYSKVSSEMQDAVSADFAIRNGLIPAAMNRGATETFNLRNGYDSTIPVLQSKLEAQAIKQFILNHTHTTASQLEAQIAKETAAPPSFWDKAVTTGSELVTAAANTPVPGLPGSGGQNQTNSNTGDQIKELVDVLFAILPLGLILFGVKVASNLFKSVDKNTKF